MWRCHYAWRVVPYLGLELTNTLVQLGGNEAGLPLHNRSILGPPFQELVGIFRLYCKFINEGPPALLQAVLVRVPMIDVLQLLPSLQLLVPIVISLPVMGEYGKRAIKPNGQQANHFY